MRNWINLVEHASISDEIASRILSDHRVKRGPLVSPKTTLWRGESEESGSGMATYGLGLYFTTSKKLAAQYGRVREVSRDDLPFGCLRFDTVNDFQIWYQRAFKLMGYESNLDVWRDYAGMDEFIRAIDPNIDGLQIGKGRDALFVRYP